MQSRTVAAADRGAPSKADEPERLAALKGKGVLSEEEFASAKTEVLGEGPAPGP